MPLDHEQVGFILEPDTPVSVTLRAGTWLAITESLATIADPGAFILMNTASQEVRRELERAAGTIWTTCQQHPAAVPDTL